MRQGHLTSKVVMTHRLRSTTLEGVRTKRNKYISSHHLAVGCVGIWKKKTWETMVGSGSLCVQCTLVADVISLLFVHRYLSLLWTLWHYGSSGTL